MVHQRKQLVVKVGDLVIVSAIEYRPMGIIIDGPDDWGYAPVWHVRCMDGHLGWYGEDFLVAVK